jgi:hypothetical protein
MDIRRLVREKIAEYERKAAADAAAKLAAREPSVRLEARSGRGTIASETRRPSESLSPAQMHRRAGQRTHHL